MMPGKHNYKSFLTIAGSDSCGGAGLQADIKTAVAFNVYAASVVTCVTAQNSTGIKSILPVDPAIVRDQLSMVFDDNLADVIKIGLTGSPDIIKTIADFLKLNKKYLVITDTVLSSTMSGGIFDKKIMAEAYVKYLIPQSDVITPNLDELLLLTGNCNVSVNDIVDTEQIIQLALNPSLMSCRHILVTGSGRFPDILVSHEDSEYDYSVNEIISEYVNTPNLHGTGCVFSSALACSLISTENSDLLSTRNVLRAAKEASSFLNKQLNKYKDLKFGHGYGPAGFFIN